MEVMSRFYNRYMCTTMFVTERYGTNMKGVRNKRLPLGANEHE